MKPCSGCKYLVHASTMELCRRFDGEGIERRTNTYTGRVITLYGWRPKIEEMRAPGARCGPDAVLYKLYWFWRLWKRLVG